MDWIDFLRFGLALIIGGVVGLERETRDKAAGFRTLTFICGGSALFTILSVRMAGAANDPARVAANIVTGVGFLGAGVILRDGGQVKGLTTAAMIWLVAALGMGIGLGHLGLILPATAAVLFVLLVFPLIENRVEQLFITHTYQMVFDWNMAKVDQVVRQAREMRLGVHSRRIARKGNEMTLLLTLTGREHQHNEFQQIMFADNELREFNY